MKKILSFVDKQNNFIIMSFPYKFWESKKLFQRYIYILFPWIVLFAFYLTIYFNNALFHSDSLVFALMDDLADLLMIPYIWIFGYYFTMWFYKKSDDEFFKIQDYLYKDDKVKVIHIITKINRVFKLTQLFSYFIPISGFLFIDFASKNNGIWYHNLTMFGYILYTFLVCVSWYYCSCIVLTAIFSSIKVHTILKYIKEDTLINVYHNDNNCGFNEISKILVFNLGIAFYYVFAGGIIVFSDFNAYYVTNKVIKNAFAVNPWLIFVFIFMLILYTMIIVIPIIELRGILKDRIISAEISSAEDKERITSFPINIKTMRTFLSVWIIPLIMAIFAGVSALNNK